MILQVPLSLYICAWIRKPVTWQLVRFWIKCNFLGMFAFVENQIKSARSCIRGDDPEKSSCFVEYYQTAKCL